MEHAAHVRAGANPSQRTASWRRGLLVAAALAALVICVILAPGPPPAQAQTGTTPPALVGVPTIAADGRTLTITYDEALDENSIPAATAFNMGAVSNLTGSTVTSSFPIASVSVSGTNVVLTLEKPVAHPVRLTATIERFS